MKTHFVVAQEQFDGLLRWLDADRDRAGQKYEDIRGKLVKLFSCRGCHIPEELADETMDRVCRKVSKIASGYLGNPELYFYGVANLVHHEYLRQKPQALAPPCVTEMHGGQEQQKEVEYDCLEKCIQGLEPQDRNLVVDYYRGEGRARADHRRKMAMNLGIHPSTLRVRAHRIRAVLENCVTQCVRRRQAETTGPAALVPFTERSLREAESRIEPRRETT
jgi:DNA-directed RNA polymerase specialized sigma24 family protein